MVGFDKDIKPLFREVDRREMDFVFDLWAHEDVRASAERILERLEDRTMPCDAQWDDDKIRLFRTWIDEGCAL